MLRKAISISLSSLLLTRYDDPSPILLLGGRDQRSSALSSQLRRSGGGGAAAAAALERRRRRRRRRSWQRAEELARYVRRLSAALGSWRTLAPARPPIYRERGSAEGEEVRAQG